MQIFIENGGGQELFDAIEASPFSDSFREAFGREVLATISKRSARLGFEGFFDSDVTTLATGDWRVTVRCTASGKQLAAALRTLTETAKIKLLPP